MTRTRKVQITPDARQRAIEALFAMEPTPVPETLDQWERDYSALKTGLATGCTTAPLRLHRNEG